MNATKPPTASEYVVELPLPPKACAQNSHTHWRTRHRANSQYRHDCEMLYRIANIPALPSVRLSLAFYTGGRTVGRDDGLYRPQDEANAIGSFKPGQDALVDAGIVPNDSRKYVRQGPVEIYGTAREHKGKCGVVLTITAGEKL